MNLNLLDPKLIVLAARGDSDHRSSCLAVCEKTQEKRWESSSLVFSIPQRGQSQKPTT